MAGLAATLNCSQQPYQRPMVETIYLDYLQRRITLQGFVDAFAKIIGKPQITERLRIFLRSSQEIEATYNIADGQQSPRTIIHIGLELGLPPQIFYYHVIKNPQIGHYCLYISVPSKHPLFGQHFSKVPHASYSGVDKEDPTCWTFGWHYSYVDVLNPYTISMHCITNPNALLSMHIINPDWIAANIKYYSSFLANYPNP